MLGLNRKQWECVLATALSSLVGGGLAAGVGAMGRVEDPRFTAASICFIAAFGAAMGFTATGGFSGVFRYCDDRRSAAAQPLLPQGAAEPLLPPDAAAAPSV